MTVQITPRYQRHGTLATAFIITRREVWDGLRDWRILTPIILLTLVFPFLMDFTARTATNWIQQYGAELIVERLNPFLLMIVGFFPISFSLVIALESFVGEKERNSLEPILSMPVTDRELYLGKVLSSLIIPLLGAYLGITVFLISRALANPPWIPSLELAVLMILLTSAKALLMVSGAVVVSSQTTSVRAANLLASFIIIPMAFLVQAESVVMFYADYRALWFILMALLISCVILVRMGIRIFNREDILSKELDELNLRTIWRDFKGYFLRPPEYATDRKNDELAKFSLVRFYKHDIPTLLVRQKLPFVVILITIALALVASIYLAETYTLPPGTLKFDEMTEETFNQTKQTPLFGSVNTQFIFKNNLRVVVLGGAVSIISFGALTLLVTGINAMVVGYLINQVVLQGYDPLTFILAFIIPHGILEIPAIIIGLTFALRIGAGLASPPEGLDVGQGLLLTTANYFKIVIFVVIPTLLLAAFIEANITPQIVLAMYVGR